MLVTELPSDSMTPTTVQLPPLLTERLRIRVNNLRMLPAVATQALEVAKDPECAIYEFAAVVERDPSLAADILRMANSIMFRGTREVMNLHHAVVRLGFRQCKNLILASSFSSMMKKISLEEEWAREVLWRHSYSTALVALNLNKTLRCGFQGDEFAAGLIHDIGRMLLAVCFPEEFRFIDQLSFEENDDTLRNEEKEIETNHCEVGAWFIQKNNLPEALGDVVRYHHFPSQSQHNRKFVALIAASDHMANHLQRCGEPNGYDASQNAAIAILEESGVANASTRLKDCAFEIMGQAQKDATEMLAC